MTPLPLPTPVQALVDALADSHRTGRRLDARDWANALTCDDDAYAVQAGVAAALGWRPEAWKSGGATPAGPFGHSPVSLMPGPALLGVEVEVAFRLGRDVTPAQARAAGAADAVDAVCAAIECLGSRWLQGLAAPERLRMADFQSNAGLLLGAWQAWPPAQALDWPQRRWTLTLEGQAPLTRRGGHAMGDPAAVLPAWLRHATRDGATVAAGTVVTTGAWAGLHACAAGARGVLQLEGLPDFNFWTAAPSPRQGR